MTSYTTKFRFSAIHVFTETFTLFTRTSPNGSTDDNTTQPKDCLDIADLLFAKSCPRSLHSIYSGKPVSRCQLSRRKGSLALKQKIVSRDGLCVLGKEREHFGYLERFQVTESSAAGLLHFHNDFSLFCGHSLCGHCVEFVPESHRGKLQSWKKKNALASICRYLPPKVKTPIIWERKECLLLSCLLKSLWNLITI